MKDRRILAVFAAVTALCVGALHAHTGSRSPASIPPPNPSSKRMFARAMYWAKTRFDEKEQLVHFLDDERDGPPVDAHWTRESAAYALGLLMRDTRSEGDFERAVAILDRVLKLQYLDATAPEYGSFRKHSEDPEKPATPDGFDPNWRQFIGTTLAVVLDEFGGRLPEELVGRIKQALVRAVEGELARPRLAPEYTNVALLHAFLANWVGVRAGRADLAKAGEDFAGKVVGIYATNGAFPEFNAPTYYGYDFYALSLWRSRSPSSRMREWGAHIEHGLWLESAGFYNPAMKNLSGPFSRIYRMDMTRYVSTVGLILFGQPGIEDAPFPSSDVNVQQGLDYALGPLVAATPPIVPDEAIARFNRMPANRLVSKRISIDPPRVATAWLGDTLMIGGESTGLTRSAGETHGQYAPATVYWKLPAGGYGWLRLRKSWKLNATASEGELLIESLEGNLVFEAFAPGAAQENFGATLWNPPGLTLSVGAESRGFRVRQISPDTWELSFANLTRLRLSAR